jgi:hypothetical protein
VYGLLALLTLLQALKGKPLWDSKAKLQRI